MTGAGKGRFVNGQSGNPRGRPKALQLQTYQAALKGRRMAIRKVLRMIEKREKVLAQARPAKSPVVVKLRYSSDSANEALHLLGIADV